ncbi:Protein CBG02234 [Caenorhabditis briggsae]|uniref:Protein CBG02234 n=1 Tax=Caenorhabditis briggsae TaxID=6238 RepID=A8WS79_CAEBR|nr:Protein CBG02234 [Caenorhabditis briggsae]CAP23337.2 Protein CBG02234 [Caenorhabditis briggsae]
MYLPYGSSLSTYWSMRWSTQSKPFLLVSLLSSHWNWTVFFVGPNFLASMDRREDTLIKFCCFLFVMLHWIMWGFVGVYTWIISCGMTMAMRMFQKSDVESRKPFNWITVKNRWRKYMNCQEQPLWKIFFIPKSRRLVSYQDYKEMIM